MNPIDEIISKKIEEEHLIGQVSMLEKVVSKTKWHIFAFSLFATGVGIHFFLTLFTRVKVAVPFTVFIGLHLFLLATAGFLAFYFDSEIYNRYYAYFTLAQILINLILLVIAIYALNAPLEFRKALIEHVNAFRSNHENPELDEIQLSLRCCGHSSPDEFQLKLEKNKLLSYFNVDPITIKEDSKPEVPKDEHDYLLPLTCCEEVDKDRKCSRDLATETGCWTAFKEKVENYRLRAFVLMVLLIFLQVLFVVAFSYTINTENS